MMYTIDLLKGRGIPIKNRRGGIFIIAATIAVPVIIAMGFYTEYLLNKIEINRTDISIRDHENKISQMKEAVKSLSSMEQQCGTLRDCITDVSMAIGRNVQWSPILQLIVENMPATTQLNKLDVSLVMLTKQMPDKADPKKLVNVPYSSRTLHISLHEFSKSDSGEAVRTFIQALRSSKIMNGKVDDIRIASQEREAVQGVEVTRYDIDCIFKPQI
jgi:hypothetical protein